ncbi:MAG: hypothetical protein M1456_07255 [Actinobacteria bacterium]|nr:hypothetical protein [Actinomycetota bacterium]
MVVPIVSLQSVWRSLQIGQAFYPTTKGIIRLAGTHGHLEAQWIGISGAPPPRLRITALSSSGRRSSLPLLLRLALLVWMNGSLIQPACPLSLLRDTTLAMLGN